MTTRTDLIADLLGTVGRFRRQLRRAAGRGFGGVGLTDSQAELLRLVGRRPGISVSEAATELGLAANTASTLVSKLVSDAMLVRECDSVDRRVGRLRLTRPAQKIADRSRAARRTAISGALESLDADEITDLAKGLTVLTKMTQILDERQP